MAIGDDFSIDYNYKRIHHTSGTTVYTVNALYSWLQDTFDELVQMDDEVPMTAQTPTEYTMVNGWWLDIGDDSNAHKYLRGGAIATSGQTNVIRLLKLEAWTGGTLTSGDIGDVVDYNSGGDGSTGVLIGYDNTNHYLWVRQDDTGDVFSDTTNTIDVGGVSYGSIKDVNGTLSGDELFANIYTLGTIATNPYPQIYVFQNKEAIAEWSSLTNWDRGHIDIVIQVKEMGVEIDGAVVTVFARQGGDLYNHFEIDLSAGGRNAVPLATSTDLDQDDTGDYFLLYDGETGGGFAAGDIIVGASSGSEAEILAVTDWGTEGVLRLIGVSGDFTDNENLQVSGATRGVANGDSTAGCVGDTFMYFDNESGTLTTNTIYYATSGSTARRLLVGKDSTNSALVLRASPSSETNLQDEQYHYHKYVDDETISDGTNTADVNMTSGSAMGQTIAGYSIHCVSGYSDIKIQNVNLDLAYDGQTVNFSVGDIVKGATSGSFGIVIADNDQGTSGTLTLGNVTGPFQDDENLQVEDATGGGFTTHAVADGTGEIIHTTTKNYELGSSYNYDVIIDMNYYDIAGTQSYHMAPHTVAELYEYLKFVNRWDSSTSIYKVQRPWGKVYFYNETGTSYTDETSDWISDTADDVLFDMTEQEDALYFGSTEKFNKVWYNLTTEGDHANTITWEYYNGSTWTAVTHNGDAGEGESQTGAGDFDGSGTGWYAVWWDMPTNWAAGDGDGTVEQDYYWVRARVSSFSSTTTDPVIGQGYMWEIYNPEVGEEYTTAYYGYAEKAASPFGTFAGGVFFGAQGVWIENMATSDEQAYSLIDSDGSVRNPPNKQPITITGLESGDRVTVFRLTGNGGEIDKDIYTVSSGSQYGSSVVMTASLDDDTPTTGVLRIVDDSESLEYRIRYASWSSDTVTLRTKVTSTTDQNGGATILYDADGDFVNNGIIYGDIVCNETDGSYAYAVTVAAGQVTTTALSGGSGNTWDSGDTYSFHTIPETLTGSDTAYIPFIDKQATGSTETVTVIYTTDRDILARVRKKGIIPFEIESDFDSDGVSIPATRTTDSIVS